MSDREPTYPVHELNLTLLACDPGEALEAGNSRYADFSKLRQGVGVTRLKKQLLALQPEGRRHHSCLCGHRGSGKSTELLALQKWADDAGFLAVHMEVDEHFGLIELEFSDLFLLTAMAVEKGMEKFGHPLPQDKIRRVIQWFAETTKEDTHTVQSEISLEAEAQLGGSLPLGLGKLLAKLATGVKGATSHALSVRNKIRNFPDTLVDLTNDLVRTANEILSEQGRPRGLLLLFDNLDRYEPERVDRVLFRSSELVRRLEGHAIFVIPIALEYEPLSGATQDCYGYSLVLPMPTLRRKESTWAATVEESAFDSEDIAVFRAALALRVELELFEKPEDIDRLIKMSGGCIRDLMHLVTLAFTHGEEDATHFSSQAVEKAIREMRATYIRRLNPDDYERLALIAHRKPSPPGPTEEATDDQKWREQTRRLLFGRFALEYLDEEARPWMDVHPIVIETEEFRRAFDRHRALA